MKNLQLLFIFLCLSIQGVQAQGENVTATWTFETGAENQAATISSNSIFSSNLVQLTGMKYAGQRKWNDEYYTQLQPTIDAGKEPSSEVYAAFTLTPYEGVTFRPTKVSFDCIRIGTGGCNVDYAIAAGNDTPIELATGIHPNRNNSDYTECTSTSAAAYGVEATNAKPLRLILYVYNLATSKQIALKNIVISGEIGQNIDLQNSYNLTKESIESIMAALSTTATSKSVTFNQQAVNRAFTDEEWATLANTRSNWTINLV